VQYCISLICFHQDAKRQNMGVLHISRGEFFWFCFVAFCFLFVFCFCLFCRFFYKQYDCYTENMSGLIRNSCTKHCNLFVGATWAGRHRRRRVRFAENEINEHRGQWGKSISNKPTLLHIPPHSTIDFSLPRSRLLLKC
jgi:hypothetical protein